MTASLSPQATKSWQLLADRAAAEPDPRRRAHLEMVLRHIAVEVAGDLDALMATLSPEPRYRVWGASHSTGPKGYDAVRAMYEASIAIGKNRLEFQVSRVMVEDDAILTEGLFRHAYSGHKLVEDGIADTSEVNPRGWYLVEYRALIVWVMAADGLIAGEDTYKGEPPRILGRLAPGERSHLGPVDRY